MYLYIHSTPMRLLYVLGYTYKSPDLKKDEMENSRTQIGVMRRLESRVEKKCPTL